MAHYTQENSFISHPDPDLHVGMDDHKDLETENGNLSGDTVPQRLLVQPEDNAVDGFSSGAVPQPVCTSTPCPTRCQSHLVDSKLAFVSPFEEDSGLGTTLPSFESPFSSFSACMSRTQPPLHTLSSSSCTGSRVSCCESSRCGGTDCQQTRSRHCLSSLSPLVLDTPPQTFGYESKSLTSVSGWNTEEKGIKGRISSTPLSLSMLALLQHSGVPVASTPTDSDSPITGEPLSLTETPDSEAAACLAMFHDYRAPRTTTAFIPPPPLWDSPLSQPLPGEDEEVSQDDAYFTSSRLSVLTSPSGMEEDSNQSLEPLQLRMKQVLAQFTPSVPERLVGRWVGVEYMDIIVELNQQNLPACGVIPWLRPYLQPADFLRMCGVCQQWRRICLQDQLFGRYWKRCFRTHSRPEEKENLVQLKGGKGSGTQRGLTKASGCLGNMQASVPSSIKHELSSPDLYEKTRKSLRWEELLQRCPQCQNVARVVPGQETAQCQNHSCNYDFCTRCQDHSHPDRPCRAHNPQAQHDLPGNKRAKKQLKRILNL